ncbi:uncharacterized protein [Oryza sativa Japonica Group]|uniref:uncharacterized protein n=1 Tax=Oryza sativa subsp. japonica TaxID=39947 RepID=UPI00339BE40B
MGVQQLGGAGGGRGGGRRSRRGRREAPPRLAHRCADEGLRAPLRVLLLRSGSLDLCIKRSTFMTTIKVTWRLEMDLLCSYLAGQRNIIILGEDVLCEESSKLCVHPIGPIQTWRRISCK